MSTTDRTKMEAARKSIVDHVVKNNCFVYGGYVYKTMLRGDATVDVDIAVPQQSMNSIVNDLQKKFECVVNSDSIFNRYSRYSRNDKTINLTCPDAGQISLSEWMYNNPWYLTTQMKHHSIIYNGKFSLVYPKSNIFNFYNFFNSTDLDKTITNIQKGIYEENIFGREKDMDYVKKNWKRE